ncbi:hypothetical protein [Arthrobacter psychrochitiniphilus]|uniref:hypothetical protein n=1 Tax=Arthrobacter psychrochitiniphilus TaxID=291045 RepID=UPI0011B80E4F|nr:hypothetical protein [Arthrobacter psychrochitiniphilus]NYG17342.1 ABC-type uncharacterized transport system permease subunit [Arthrobacter psychrochitiniphilus]
MRSALVYALLMGCIMAVYAAVLAVAAARLTGDPVTALVAAALIAVGISPLLTSVQWTASSTARVLTHVRRVRTRYARLCGGAGCHR